MEQDDKKTFGNFDLGKALKFLKLPPPLKWKFKWQPIKPSDFLVHGLEETERQVTVGSNEWDYRLFMGLVFLETLKNHSIRMWQEKRLDAGESPFRGKVDFAFTAYQVDFESPYLIMSEAKKEAFEQGWGQCLIAMKTCQILNEKEGHVFDMLGIVSTGRIWEFGKLTVDNQFYKSEGYTLAQPDILLGILDYMFTLSEQNME